MKTLQGRVIPETVAEALEAWDAGAEVRTVMMGNGSFADELTIQTAMFELLRAFGEDPEYGALAAAESLARAATDELVKRIEISLIQAERVIREHWESVLTGEQGGQAAALALQIHRLGFPAALKIADTRARFIANPAAIQPNRAERRAAEAAERKLN